MSFQTIALFGSTGTLGTSIGKALAEKKSSFKKIIAITQPNNHAKSAAYNELKSHGFEVRVADIKDPSSLRAALQGVDVVISALGAAAFESQSSIIDASVSAGVRRFYPSEFGANIEAKALKDENIFAHKRTIRNKLRDESAKNPAFSYTIVETGVFSDMFLKSAEWIGLNPGTQTFEAIGSADLPISWNHLTDVGRYTVATLLQKEELSKNRIYRFSTENATWRDFANALGESHGKSYSVSVVPTAEALKKEGETWASGNIPEAVRLTLRRVVGISHEDVPVDNKEFPEIKPTTLKQAAKELLSQPKF